MRDPKPFRRLPFFWSVLALSFVFSIFTFARTYDSFPSSISELESLANLKSLQENGHFYSFVEPLPFLMLVFWNKISFFSLNLTVITLSAFFFSLFLHLFLLLLRREEWKRNHYILPFLSAFLPFSIQFPSEHFTAVVCLVFVLLIFLTFKMEVITDLLVFPALTILAFLSDLKMFLLAFSFFVLFTGLRKAQTQAQRTSVFFKKKNIPLILVLIYFSFLALVLFLFQMVQFFGNNSIEILLLHWYSLVKLLAIPLIVISIGYFLLKTEKELNTVTATGITVVLILVSMFFAFRESREFSNNELNTETEELDRILKQRKKEITSDNLYLPYSHSLALYLKSNLETKWRLDGISTDPNDKNEFSFFIYIAGFGESELQPLEKDFGIKKGKLPGVFPLSPNNAIVQTSLFSNVHVKQKFETISFYGFQKMSEYPTPCLADRYNSFLQAVVGFSKEK